MSQFNSIFSPLTNKLARLAGITLLAVAALFASTQQMSAQIGTTTCVTSLEVRLGDNCQSTVTSQMVLVGTSSTYDVRINDLNPTNGGVVDGVSPASGWSYGVYVSNAANAALICQGVIFAVDYTAPSVVAPAAVDFIADDISLVLNQSSTWNDSTSTYFAGNLLKTLNGFADNPSRTDSTLTITDNCSMPVAIRVTDKIDYTECTGAVSAKPDYTIFATITRSFQATDRRGNDTTVTQIIRFLRPLLASLDSLAGPAAENGSGSASYGRINSVSVLSTNGLSGANANKYLAGLNSADTIVFNNCTPPLGDKASLRPYLRSLYRVGYSLPLDTKSDTNFVFGSADNTVRFANYNADFTVTEFPTCNGGKKFKITTTFMDMCPNNSQGMVMDDVILVFEDRSKPVFEANTTTINGILGLTVGAPVQISVGTNDCTASLRLGTQTSLRDLASVFNVKVTDAPTGCASAVTLSYRFETKDYWNNKFFVPQSSWVVTNYTTINTGTSAAPLMSVIGLPVGNHRVTITATDQCNNQQSQTLYFDVVDKVAPVMKCDDLINVTLSSNFSSNYFIDGAGGGISDRDVTNDARARVYVSDINEGSRDNCTLDSLYVRRKVDWASCQSYLRLNLDYDIFGNNDGSVTAADFVDGYTPVGMQYVEIFCCDSDNVMFELWGSDMKHYNNSNASGGNWSFCWGTINRENKVSPTLSEPNHAATYNAGTRNWIQCTDKDWIGDSQLNGGSMGTNDWITVTTTEIAKNTYDEKLGRISNVRLSNATFG